jgi:hypothetical protein
VPPGDQLHIVAVGEDGKVRVIEVWDTREQAEAFGERVREARERAGCRLGRDAADPLLRRPPPRQVVATLQLRPEFPPVIPAANWRGDFAVPRGS